MPDLHAPPARLDPATGLFTGYASLFGIPDAQHDVVERGAFSASLLRRGPAGIRMLWQHDPAEPIGMLAVALRGSGRPARHRPPGDADRPRPRGARPPRRGCRRRALHRLQGAARRAPPPRRPPPPPRGRSLGGLGRHLPGAGRGAGDAGGGVKAARWAPSPQAPPHPFTSPRRGEVGRRPGEGPEIDSARSLPPRLAHARRPLPAER